MFDCTHPSPKNNLLLLRYVTDVVCVHCSADVVHVATVLHLLMLFGMSRFIGYGDHREYDAE